MPGKTTQRLDELLVARGLFASRSRASDAVKRGTVRVSDAVVTKAGQLIDPAATLSVDDPAQGYVSRAALKLIAGLDHFGIEVSGKTVLDLGASTGGFTQVALERGAASVFAVDVGHGQLHPSLASDPRVTSIENKNARELSVADLGGAAIDLIVCDVSFISLTLALPPALDLAAPGAAGVFLVKPQFEAGRDAIGKGGLLKDPAEAPRTAERLRLWLDAQPGWTATGLTPSPIEGGDGNKEFLLGGKKSI
ncbi:TlyA family RNA methyltransferase [Tianweitania sp. BSSL-BM11]|uniref:TlyA family RNA methyltransferase n=1 Tax=Tianweitania aestuarii TaxID=2814886 RepID=A0ABS5RRT5_9HYPH|nr:TlyA family RNA methyltransferase [Tianweitania aestuarii]MBS9719770.1 TlyA family RNA methyltransferase [Tianweitania aestuarii]